MTSELDRLLEQVLMDHTEEAFIFLGTNRRIVSFNRQFADLYRRFFGKEVEVGADILDYAQTSNVENLRALYDRVFMGETFEIPMDIPIDDSRWMHYLLRYKPARTTSGTIVGAFVTGQDISPQRKAVLDRDTLLDNTDEPFWSADREFKLIAGNSGFINSLQRSTGRTLKPGDDLLLPDFPADFIAFWKGLYERGLAGETFIETVRTPQVGEVPDHWSQVRIAPIQDRGNVVGVACYGRDITELKQRQLENERLIRELEMHNQDLRQFSYVVSHNLRSPIHNLKALVELAEPLGETNPELNELLEGFRSSIRLLQDTINDLSDILLVRDQPSAEKEPLDIAAVFADVVSNISKLVEAAGADIRTDFSASPVVNYPRSYLVNILLNLLTNALKYRSPDRPLVIEVATARGNNGRPVLRFADNGIGIDIRRHQDRLFGLYQRFHDRPDSKGLGLYLVRSQVEAMGGTIRWDSAPDQGSTFTIRF